VTNVNDDGSIPATETRNWEVPGMNNFRVNQQGEGLFNSPDLVVRDPHARIDGCPPVLAVWARVANIGSLGVPSGIPVSFYYKDAAADVLLGTTKTTKRLLPGESEVVGLSLALPAALKGKTVEAYAVADDDGTGAGTKNECKEDNNKSDTAQAVLVEGAETCNGIDDNCNEEADEGDGLCPEQYACIRGECVEKCWSGECPQGRTCALGYCLTDGECVLKACPADSVCIRSKCMKTCNADADCTPDITCTGKVCYEQ